MTETVTENGLSYHFVVPGDDFTRAGEASGSIKSILKKLGIRPDVVRKVAISMYEGEIDLFSGERQVKSFTLSFQKTTARVPASKSWNPRGCSFFKSFYSLSFSLRSQQ